MSKGTPSMGKRQKTTHIVCRRCGKISFHKRHGVCASCGFGKSPRLRKYNWISKN
ncbi:50S ribosomal protein L37e [Methanogenium marinum]|uniref:Large ribosomal subunit protein eL37 n=1 Tax=Methanogenium marinum TaxID=348610 RepID=A0A9Q4PW59_9EURY|nr:50S ribosomal protein L37e [Methanogenium marinum]MDE4908304.1 50S ribosomal protein L37e [Methanogenium marinum]